jgi:signal transduction histidine kinase
LRLRSQAPRAAWLLAILAVSALHAREASSVATLDRAEAAPAGWHATAPPATGWTPVKLPDDWSNRWPHHDGVVWYRLHWNQANAAQPAGLLLNQVILADAVYVNGSLIHRDPHLVEPLSRSWIKPQYFLLDQPLLHAGDNTLTVRVSGLADYQPGLGVVTIGDPRAVYAQYHADWRMRFQLRLYNQAIYLAMGLMFLVLWLFRRRDTIYGWFAASTALTAAFDWNNVAPSTWPFGSTDAFQSWNMVFYIAASVSLAVFLLRFCQQRWPRTEAVLWLYTAATALCALCMPHFLGTWRFKLALPAVALYYAIPLAFAVYTARHRQPERVALAVCLLIPLPANVHDVMRFFEIIHDRMYVSALTSPLTLLGMSVVLAYRFAAAMRRTEAFNAELRREVDAATASLADTLARQHALELDHTRIGERLHLVRDLHDGFGGSLVGAIVALEQSPPTPENARTIATLKELRDDLRLVIDTTTHSQHADLAELLAPLQHRWDQRLDLAGIDSRWQLDGLAGLHLGAAASLDLLRFLQEALTNALKHSGAACVEVVVQRLGEHLHVEVRDDGRGFDPAARKADGAGLASLHARATRLGGRISLDAAPARGVVVRLDFSLAT